MIWVYRLKDVPTDTTDTQVILIELIISIGFFKGVDFLLIPVSKLIL